MTTPISRCLNATLILLFLTLSFLSYAEKPVFQFVNAIGDERDNYFFPRVSGIAFSDKKDIFVIDRKNFSVIKYDWNGTFISRTGRLGKGPGDFLTPSGIQCFNNKLYIYDYLNRRIAVTDWQMERFDYIKIGNLKDDDQRIYSMRGAPIVLGENLFLGISHLYSLEKGRLFFFDKDQNVNKYFFCDLPTDLDDEKWRIKEGEEKRFLFNHLTFPVLAVNQQKKQMLVTFEHPDTDIRFFLCKYSGELIRKFSYRQDKSYKFPRQQLDDLMNPPSKTTVILEILPYKDYYLVFMVQIENRRTPNYKNNFYYLFVHENGEIKYKMESDIRFITITPDGYLGGTRLDKENDILKVVIYKLNLEAIKKNIIVTGS
jgi:hypothetical protein